MEYKGRIDALPGYDKGRDTYTSTADWRIEDIITHTPRCLPAFESFMENKGYRAMIQEFDKFKKTVRETGEWQGVKIEPGQTMVFGDYAKKEKEASVSPGKEYPLTG